MNNEAVNAATERFNQEGDWIARQFFSPADLQLSPEEYAARGGHLFGCFAIHRYRYRDPVLGAWVRRLGEILGDAGELERCRQLFLTPEELAEVQRQEAEGL
jgi:hypothetical protein